MWISREIPTAKRFSSTRIIPTPVGITRRDKSDARLAHASLTALCNLTFSASEAIACNDALCLALVFDIVRRFPQQSYTGTSCNVMILATLHNFLHFSLENFSFLLCFSFGRVELYTCGCRLMGSGGAAVVQTLDHQSQHFLLFHRARLPHVLDRHSPANSSYLPKMNPDSPLDPL